nr:hypothetical protein [Candidatus Woesearchaeota archaeon]
MDEYLEQMLKAAKYKIRKDQIGLQKAANEYANGLFALTEEERKRFSNLSSSKIISSIIERYDIDDSNTNPESVLYPDGLVHLIDNDGREYRDTLESLGYKLIDGVYTKND